MTRRVDSVVIMTQDGDLGPISPNNEPNLAEGTLGDVQTQLDEILAYTKQTSLDLEQLFDRLKNNNQHLNKLLESIAAYSNEVVTEGNATKNDVTLLFDKLLQYQKQNDNTLEEIQAQTSTIVSEMKKVTKERELTELEQKWQQLQQRNVDLEKKYDSMCLAYNEKYKDFQALEQKYDELSVRLQQVDPEKYFDLEKVQKLKNLHTMGGDSLSIPKRKVSSPLH